MEYFSTKYPGLTIITKKSPDGQFNPEFDSCIVNPEYKQCVSSDSEFIVCSMRGKFRGSIEGDFEMISGKYNFMRGGQKFSFEGSTKRLALEDGILQRGNVILTIRSNIVVGIAVGDIKMTFSSYIKDNLVYFKFAPKFSVNNIKYIENGDIVVGDYEFKITKGVITGLYMIEDMIYKGEWKLTSEYKLVPENKGKIICKENSKSFEWYENEKNEELDNLAKKFEI